MTRPEDLIDPADREEYDALDSVLTWLVDLEFFLDNEHAVRLVADIRVRMNEMVNRSRQ